MILHVRPGAFIKGNEEMVGIPTHRTPTHPGEMLREEFLETIRRREAVADLDE